MSKEQKSNKEAKKPKKDPDKKKENGVKSSASSQNHLKFWQRVI